MQQSLVKKLVLLLLVISIGATSKAQAPGFGDDVDDNSGGGTQLPAIPLDGGLSLLVAAGVAYGAKRKLGIRNQEPRRN
jgi:hypothetical protein